MSIAPWYRGAAAAVLLAFVALSAEAQQLPTVLLRTEAIIDAIRVQ